MKFCPNCGVKSDDDNFKFCPECGYRFESDSNSQKSGGLICSLINRVIDEIPDEYVEKIRDNEIIDEALTHAKIILNCPQTEKERRKHKCREKRYKRKVEIQEDDIDMNKGLKTCPNCSKQIPHNALRCKYCKTMLKTYSDKGTSQSSPAPAKTYEADYSNLELSDLQERLIKSLPIIDSPSEYEENIINKYAQYDSKERKELLKDCWTVTKLAEKNNVKRRDVENAILTDEFLNKDLIRVFKVNPKNVRSLKILYRKPLTENQQ